MPKTRRCVLLAGGYSHPFEETGAALAQMTAASGWIVDQFSNPEQAVDALSEETDLLVVNALFWSMTQHEKYEPDRAAWAHHLRDQDLAAISDHVKSGGSLLAVHTSVICWDTQPGWIDLLGGGWRWGQSYHPPMGKAEIRLTGNGRKLSDGPDQFTLLDEVYHALSPKSDCQILAEGVAEGEPQPVAWLRENGAGLVGVDALGHDSRSLTDPGHAGLVRGMLNIFWRRGVETTREARV
ncbi:ThuA domain-containing protein [Pacificimonas sp. ICDLI1SI03]